MIARRALLGGLASLPMLSGAARAAALPTVGKIERFDAGLDAVIDPAAPIEVIAQGIRWAEGPLWVAKGGYLLFTDVPANVVYRWRPGGKAEPFLSPAGLQTPIPATIREAGLNGLTLDRGGALLGADSGTRAIVRVDLATRRRTILADRYEGKRFNSPNDLCVAPDGAIYFTDPTYGLAGGDESPLRELSQSGVYRLTPDGKVALVDGSHRRPNGIALTRDGKTLYLAQSDEDAPEVFAYDLGADGMPTASRRFRDMRKERAAGLPGLPDGMKVGASGHVFASGPGGIHICAPDGTLLGIVSTGKAIANCCFGEDGRTLFLTSSDMVAKVRLKARQ